MATKKPKEVEKQSLFSRAVTNCALFSFAFTIIVAIVGFLVNTYITNYHSSYLQHFGINTDDISIVVKLSDVSKYGMGVVLLFASCSLAVFGVSILYFHALTYVPATYPPLPKFLSNLFNKNNFLIKFLRAFGKLLSRIEPIVSKILACASIVLGIGVFAILYLHFCTGVPVSAGSANASSQTTFSVISEDEDVAEVLIYQSDNIGVVKRFNKQSGKFENGYGLRNTAGMDIVRRDLLPTSE